MAEVIRKGKAKMAKTKQNTSLKFECLERLLSEASLKETDETASADSMLAEETDREVYHQQDQVDEVLMSVRLSSLSLTAKTMARNEMTGIVREDVDLPDDQKGGLAFVLYNVLTPQECTDYIKMTEERGYIQAKVNIGGGREKTMTDVRNSDRCIVDSFEEAGKLWQRIKAYIPAEWKGHSVLGLNERLRFLRYEPGQFFKPHFDGRYRRDNGERSYITFQLYLNEGFQGGSTTFLHRRNKDQRCEVVPKTGSVLIFEHALLHEGSMLNKGRKYTMRTDVMFSAEARSHSTDQQLES